MNRYQIPSLFLITMIMLSSCSRSYMVKSQSTKVVVEQVNVVAVEYNRPDFEAPDHDDFKNKNRELKCMSGPELWSDVLKNQKAAIDCVNSIEDAKATYFYVPTAQPYLEIDQEEETNPKCLKTALAKIALPREIYYFGRQIGQEMDDKQLSCFSSSFSTNTNQILNTKTGFLKKKIVIPFPLDRKLKNVNDLTMWLTVTTFTILKSDEQAEGQLLATPVPEDVCRQCFKNDALFDDKYTHKIKPVFWP